MVKKIKTEEFDKLLKGDKPVVCDFFADWCGPCKMLAPVIDECSEQYADKAVFVKVNVDESPDLASRYGIMAIPFIGVFVGGNLADKSVGYSAKDELEKFLEKNV